MNFVPDNKSIIFERCFVVCDCKFELIGVFFSVDVCQLVSDKSHVYIILREACDKRVQLRVYYFSKLGILDDGVNQFFWLRIRVVCFQRVCRNHARGHAINVFEVKKSGIGSQTRRASIQEDQFGGDIRSSDSTACSDGTASSDGTACSDGTIYSRRRRRPGGVLASCPA